MSCSWPIVNCLPVSNCQRPRQTFDDRTRCPPDGRVYYTTKTSEGTLTNTMPPERKSARFEPTIPLPPQTILSLETELSYFRRRCPLSLETDLRLLGRVGHPYPYPVGRRGTTPERHCLDWTQHPLTPAVAAAIRNFTETAESGPPPLNPRACSRQPTPVPASRQPTPARQPSSGDEEVTHRQPAPGPSTSLSAEDASQSPRTPSRRGLSKTVRFPSDPPEVDDEQEDGEATTVILQDADGLISRPGGEVGRHQRGFSLKNVLGWSGKKFKTHKEVVNAYVADFLNHSLSASNQPKDRVTDMAKLVSCRFPYCGRQITYRILDSSQPPYFRSRVSGWLANS